MKFAIVDVFAESAYTGNQLAVFTCPTPLPTEEMQRIAREINFSESVFIQAEAGRTGGWDARIFTPAHEVEFAGHPTLGAAHIIRRDLMSTPSRSVHLHFKAGTVPVTFSPDRDGPLWMQQIAPVFGETFPTAILADILGLPSEAIDDRFPIQEVSTGLPHILVPLRSLDFLRQARVDRPAYFRFIERTWANNILIFCLQGRNANHQVSVRMFADYLGIAEDPATGSGNGCLAGYLVKHRCLGRTEIDIVSGQGHEIDRPSLLFLQAEARAEGISIRVGGRVVDVAAGQWHRI